MSLIMTWKEKVDRQHEALECQRARLRGGGAGPPSSSSLLLSESLDELEDMDDKDDKDDDAGNEAGTNGESEASMGANCGSTSI